MTFKLPNNGTNFLLGTWGDMICLVAAAELYKASVSYHCHCETQNGVTRIVPSWVAQAITK